MGLIRGVAHRFLSLFSLFISDNQRNLRPYLLLELKCVSPARFIGDESGNYKKRHHQKVRREQLSDSRNGGSLFLNQVPKSYLRAHQNMKGNYT